MTPHSAPSRRQLLAGLAGASALSAAGCIGSEDSNTVRMGAGTQGSATFAATQALQSVVDEHADEAELSAQETSGSGAGNFRLFDNGEIDGGGFDNYAADQAANDTGTFADESVDTLPYQGFFYVLSHIYMVTPSDSDVETTDDLVDKNVWLNPPGTSVRPPTDAVFEQADLLDDISVQEQGRSDLAGALEEGRIDALVVYGVNYKTLPGWVTELDTRFDFDAVVPTDSFDQAIRDAGGVGYEVASTYGWEQDVGVDELPTWGLGAQFRFGEDVPTDVAKTITEIAYEQNEAIIDANGIYPSYEDASDMKAVALPDQPVHPGVAEFWQDEGVWDDELTIGE